MNLISFINLYNNLYQKKNFEEVENLEKEIENKREAQFSEIIEIPYPGNFHLDILSSTDKDTSITGFLFQVMKKLEYEPVEEFPLFKVENYRFDNMMDELSTVEARDFIMKRISSNDSIAIYKLKEKDELTFLIDHPSHHIYISEIYWKS